MYKGDAEVVKNADSLCVKYKENEGVFVEIRAYESYLEIKRMSEICTTLTCYKDKPGKAVISSMYGDFEIEIVTHKYILKDHHVAISYDLVQGDEVSDGFTIIWTIKEKGGWN